MNCIRRHKCFLLVLMCTTFALRVLLRERKATSQTADPVRSWTDVPVSAEMLAVTLALVALTGPATQAAVNVFAHYELGWLAFLMGAAASVLGLSALVGLYRLYLWQQGLRPLDGLIRFLLTPYGLLAVAVALSMTLVLFSNGLVSLNTWLGLGSQ
jgi:hypothetical protein